MVVAMICLLLTAMLLGSVLKTAIAHRRQVRGEEYRHQAVWLTESAVARAVNRLDAAPDYPGETWDVAAEELGGRDSARVVIKVTRPAENVASRTVSIVSTYPVDSTRFARRTREFEFTMQDSGIRDQESGIRVKTGKRLWPHRFLGLLPLWAAVLRSGLCILIPESLRPI